MCARDENWTFPDTATLKPNTPTTLRTAATAIKPTGDFPPAGAGDAGLAGAGGTGFAAGFDAGLDAAAAGFDADFAGDGDGFDAGPAAAGFNVVFAGPVSSAARFVS